MTDRDRPAATAIDIDIDGTNRAGQRFEKPFIHVGLVYYFDDNLLLAF